MVRELAAALGLLVCSVSWALAGPRTCGCCCLCEDSEEPRLACSLVVALPVALLPVLGERLDARPQAAGEVGEWLWSALGDRALFALWCLGVRLLSLLLWCLRSREGVGAVSRPPGI